MEGSYWLRFGTIVAMLIGCLYVLAPTYLDDGSTDVSGYGSVASVEAEPILEVWLTVPDGDPDEATAAAVKARLAAAGIDAIETIQVKDGRIVVGIRFGVTKAEIVSVLSVPGAIGLWGPDALALEAEATPEDFATTAAGTLRLGPEAVALEAITVSAAAAGADGGVSVTLAGEGLEGLAGVYVTVDGKPGGFAKGPLVAGRPVPLELSIARLSVPQLVGALGSARLDEPLSRWVAPVVEDKPAAEGAGADDESAAPTGLTSMLPDTKINFGLDLQGGVDLTLQVDQDAAVFGQVQRDQAELRDQIAKAGNGVRVVRERSRPALRVYYPGEFAEAQAFIAESPISAYSYIESDSDDDGAFHVYRVSDTREAEIKKQAVEQVLETLRKRVDSTGVKEPAIVKLGGGRINIQLPGVENPQQAIDAIGTQAQLKFRLVDEEADQTQVGRMITEAEKALPAEQFEDDEVLNAWLHDNDKLSQDRLIQWLYEETEPGKFERKLPYQLQERVILTGSDVNDAGVSWDQNNQPRVTLSFKTRGKTIFCDVTTEHVNKRFAIILDDQIRSAPNIREPICGGVASIEMGSSAEATNDANTLALVLRTGSLKAPVDIGEVREIGASLGQDAIDSGILGSLIGGGVVIVFMTIWYGLPGVIANVALGLNVLLVFSLLALFGATLTLPGIAGVALTVGMAVDANIIVYERIREELKLGVNARKAVDTGYEKAVVAVLDANITTAIAGVVLYSYGTGPIKGFAVTLLIGIFTTLVTALFVTRTFMEMLTRNSSARLRI